MLLFGLEKADGGVLSAAWFTLILSWLINELLWDTSELESSAEICFDANS